MKQLLRGGFNGSIDPNWNVWGILMERFKTLWLWMIIPMIVMQAGIFLDYWGDFTDNTWAVHVHYWNATLWYLFLISQPWLFAKGRIESHRTWGMFGLLLAGAMILLSVGQLNRDIVFANASRDNPEHFGPFDPAFFFQIMMTEMVLVSAFALAVTMAIVKRKSLPDHAWWLASTAFILMFPALGRGLGNLWIIIYGFKPDPALVTQPFLASFIIISGLTLGFAWKLGQLRHPATWVAILANASGFVMRPLGRIAEVQDFWRTIIPH